MKTLPNSFEDVKHVSFLLLNKILFIKIIKTDQTIVPLECKEFNRKFHFFIHKFISFEFIDSKVIFRGYKIQTDPMQIQ